jgi:hypothetical protein
VLDILVDTLQSDHTLFELYEPPNNKEETLLNGTCERKRESGHGSIYAWRKETSEGSETNHDCGQDIESGYASAHLTLQKMNGAPESHLFTVLPWSVMTSLDWDGLTKSKHMQRCWYLPKPTSFSIQRY